MKLLCFFTLDEVFSSHLEVNTSMIFYLESLNEVAKKETQLLLLPITKYFSCSIYILETT